MGDSCGTCLALPEKYKCGWCQSTGQCEVYEQCSNQDEKKNDWLNRSQTCPNPQIYDFEPRTGPWEGGTNVTIRGVNLGKNFSDIYSGVKVAGMSCMPFANLYVNTKEIVCTVDGPGEQKHRHGRIVVQIGDYRGESVTDFQFVNPKIGGFTPKLGPMSGGTQLTIYGTHLDAGSNIKAYINDLPCEILSKDELQAVCQTSASSQKIQGKLRMEFDNGKREFDDDFFSYVDDPTIEFATSGSSGQPKVPKGIPAGGIKITVVGTHFDAIQKPKMYVYYKNDDDEAVQSFSECEVISPTEMKCDSPSMEGKWTESLNADNPMELEYGFSMDAVASVKNLSRPQRNSFGLYPNPEYFQFEENVKYFKSEYLTINGRNLDRACKESDVVVKIGNSICNITSLSRQQLTCRPPTEATDSNE